MSRDRAFLILGWAKVMCSTPSSLVTLVREARPLLLMARGTTSLGANILLPLQSDL